MKVLFQTQMSINAGEALIVGTVKHKNNIFTSTFIVDGDKNIDLSETDTDSLPDGKDWPYPADKLVRSAAKIAKNWDGI